MQISVNSKNKKQFVKGLKNAPAKTYYKYGFDKLFGRYRVTWKDDINEYTVKSLSRISDFDGYLPKISSFKDIILAISTYLESRKGFILRKPIPFIVFDAIKKLDTIISPKDKVLEFGSGNSTLWFLKKQCRITSIEHSLTWYKVLNDHINPLRYDEDTLDHFSYIISENKNTWKLIEEMDDESLDLVLVDGANEFNNRNECIERSFSKLKKGGWMVLDNSDHPNNWPGGLYMDSKYERIRFTGFAAMGLYVSQTSFWQKID
ncbi:MAG: hypothetical protein COB60_01190 [Flavobacteriaceae bacterium]|nr:MAG: hypothetical protein COB60_01190 [Flavobacteriaceae bacterium]